MPESTKVRDVQTAPSDRLKNDLNRVDHLRWSNDSRRTEMGRTRAIMDGGKAGLQVLLGNLDGYGEDELSLVPTANLMLAGIDRFAHKLGRRPDLNVLPPVNKDTDRARKRADKMVRIVESYDDADAVEMMLPQVARWLVGYGFAVFTIATHHDADGHGYPRLQLRDPYDTFLGSFGIDQQPQEVAFVRTVPIMHVARMYPRLRGRLEKLPQWGVAAFNAERADTTSRFGGTGSRGWANRSGEGVTIVELVDHRGTHVMCEDIMASLEFTPNLCATPPFRVIKRFSFNDLRGQFEHVIGLASSMAKMNLLVQIAAEDGVFTETNVYSNNEAFDYEKGRDALNYLGPQDRVEKPTTNIPFQLFQHIGTLERMLRSTARYSAQADGESPNSFATGAGLEQLASGFDAEIREYFTSLRHGLEQLDHMRLEYDTHHFAYAKPMSGISKGEVFAETYNPGSDIVTFRTRRSYGAMSGFDEPSKIATMLNLNQAGFMSQQTGMENLDGIENVQREKERILEERSMGILLQGLEAMAGQGDPKAMMALTDLMGSKDAKATLLKFFTPEGDELSAEEEAMANPPPPPELLQLPNTPPDVATVLARATDSGADVGVQRVGRI